MQWLLALKVIQERRIGHQYPVQHFGRLCPPIEATQGQAVVNRIEGLTLFDVARSTQVASWVGPITAPDHSLRIAVDEGARQLRDSVAVGSL